MKVILNVYYLQLSWSASQIQLSAEVSKQDLMGNPAKSRSNLDVPKICLLSKLPLLDFTGITPKHCPKTDAITQFIIYTSFIKW